MLTSTQRGLGQVLSLRGNCTGRLQLPRCLRIWLTINGQIDPAKPPLWDALRHHVGGREASNDEGHLDVEKPNAAKDVVA